MSTFIQRIKAEINNPMNHRQFCGKTLINNSDLYELINHFESLDSAARADNSNLQTSNRTTGLVHEVQAAFHNLGVENTMDLMMFTIAELRKHEINNKRVK